MMEFLYFPQDKSEYIPALITLFFFALGAFVTMRIILKAAKKEKEIVDETYDKHNIDESDKNPRP